MERPLKSNRTRAALFFLVLIILLIAVNGGKLGETLQPERIRSAVDRSGAWGPLLYIALFAVAPPFLLPGLPLTVAGGLAFGPLWGTVYASIGSTLGAGFAFLIARYFARDAVAGMLGEQWRWIDEGVARQGAAFVAVTRLIPLFPFNLLNYAFGLTPIPFATYLIASWLCMLPATAAYVIFSSSLLDLLKGEFSGALLVGLFLLLIVSSLPFAYRKWKRSKGAFPVLTWMSLLYFIQRTFGG